MNARFTWTLVALLALVSFAESATQERPRAYWKAIVDAGYELPEGESAYGLIVELSTHLGSTDSELRDDFGTGIPAAWILRQDLLSEEELLGLVRLWTANLQRGIGTRGDDSVLLRSFSALNLALLASRDNQEPFLAREQFDELLAAALAYLAGELDLRGWSAEAGWYHSAAHTADLLKFLARSRHLTGKGQRAIFDGIVGRLRATDGYVFVHGEDERIAAAVLSLLSRADLEVGAAEAFVDGLGPTPRPRDAHGFDPVAFAGQQNAKAVLRVLFVSLAHEKELPAHLAALRERILATLARM